MIELYITINTAQSVHSLVTREDQKKCRATSRKSSFVAAQNQLEWSE